MTGDMIVNLYLKDIWHTNGKCDIRHIFPSDKDRLLSFIQSEFPNEKGWVMEAEHGWYEGTVVIAVENMNIVGFACYDCSGKGYFGPFGVASAYRGKHIGIELMYAVFDAMKQKGYGYAVIGWVSDNREGSPTEFYKKWAMASYIPHSDPHYTKYMQKVNMENIHLQGYDALDHFRKYGWANPNYPEEVDGNIYDMQMYDYYNKGRDY